MAELALPDPIVLYLNAHHPPAGIELPGPARCIPFPRLWTHVRLSAEMVQKRPGVLFVPAHVVPIVHPPSVVTIHDLGYLHLPELHPSGQRRVLDWSTRWSAKVSRKIIAISESTKTDLVAHYDVDPTKITVIHHGIAPEFRPSSPDEIESLRARLRLPKRYALAVGTVQPRKNYGRLAGAVAAVNRSGTDIALVVAGKRGWMADDVEREINAANLGDRIRLLGYVEDRDLPALYSGAALFCQPSLYEGFGLPVLEAMACGAPVVASNSSSLPEITGDAALLVDPLDTGKIADAIARVLNEAELSTILSERGRAHSARFTWTRCAEQTLDLLRSVRDA
jgi:glycosyltransferase involved in cell wall biosynthesis